MNKHIAILHGPISNKIYDIIEENVDISCGERTGVNEAAEKMERFMEEMLRNAYAAGVRSMEEGKEIQWTCFEDWIIQTENTIR